MRGRRGISSRVGASSPLVGCGLILPSHAHAHTSYEGLGDFWGGAVHPLTTPAHVLVLVALGLWIGRRGAPYLKFSVMVFAPVLAFALAFTLTGWVKAVPPVLLVAVALGGGILLALEKDLPRRACAVFLVGAALALGLDSAVENASPGKAIKTLPGTWFSVVILLFDLAILVARGHAAKWLQMALRIAGAWLIAISLMVLAFSLRR